MNQSNLTSLHENGWYKHEKFIEKAELSQIEKDILLMANVGSKGELNDKIIGKIKGKETANIRAPKTPPKADTVKAAPNALAAFPC